MVGTYSLRLLQVTQSDGSSFSEAYEWSLFSNGSTAPRRAPGPALAQPYGRDGCGQPTPPGPPSAVVSAGVRCGGSTELPVPVDYP
jgi:hypothetical protein